MQTQITYPTHSVMAQCLAHYRIALFLLFEFTFTYFLLAGSQIS
jgi:hypothetical protein